MNGEGVRSDAVQGGPIMMDVTMEMRSMRLNLVIKFTSMQAQLGDLETELGTLKADIVTQEIFQSLEIRVSKLEAEGAPNVQVSWLLSQDGRLDPAYRSLCFRGVKVTIGPCAFNRTLCLQEILETSSRDW